MPFGYVASEIDRSLEFLVAVLALKDFLAVALGRLGRLGAGDCLEPIGSATVIGGELAQLWHYPGDA